VSIPTSLIVVLLVVAWLVVLVPMVAKRRDKVPRAESGGHGFRVLRRAQASLKRRPKRTVKADAEPVATEAGTTTPPTTARRQRTLVTVGAAAEEEPRDAAEDWAAAHPGYRPPASRPVDTAATADGATAADFADDAVRTSEFASVQPWADGGRPAGPDPEEAPTAEYRAPAAADDRFSPPEDGQAQGTLWAEQPEPTDPSVTDFPYARAPRIPNEVDEQEWQEHAAATSAPAHRYEVDDEALRPTPRRRGRGGYDPEAAEATRAYKYRQRRRVTLGLAAATVLFSVVALLLASWLWVGAAISAVLLALYLAYLRRQVKIEAQIRQRRMERLQRARQIRPEYGRGRAPARAGRSAAGPGRTVVDLDDDDPTFDHLEPYDPPVTYRRAAGQ
jgi:hypothetical protein